MDKTLEMLCDRLSDEIEDTVKLEKLSPASMEMLDTAVDIMKDIKEIEAMNAAYGYSGKPPRIYNNASYDNGDTGYRRMNRNYSKNDEAMSRLEQMYDEAQTDKEREVIRKLMNKM